MDGKATRRIDEPEGTVAGAVISLPFDGGVNIPVAVDPALVVSVDDHYAELHGVSGPLLVMIDTYDSAPAAKPGGRESWVRVLDMVSKAEVFHRHVESGVNGWTVASPIVTVAEDGGSFVIRRTSAPELTVALDAKARTARIVDAADLPDRAIEEAAR